MSYAAFTKRMASDAGRIHWQSEHYQMPAKHYKVSEEQVAKAVAPAPVASSFPEVVTKAAPSDVQRSFRWTMNDGEIDRSSDIVVASGVDISHFKSNPVALLGHDPMKPIGTWSGVHADGGRLKGTLNLAPTRLGEYVRENIAAGVLKAASVGFVPIEFEPIKGGGFRFDKVELMETSIVSIPSSRGSLRERSAEERKQDLKEQAAEIKRRGREMDTRLDAEIAKAAAEDAAKQRREAEIALMPGVIEARAKLAQAKARRAERELLAGMSIDEHTRYLNAKAERKAEREETLRRLREGME
jgi:HK97 family phage prohead protease